MREGWGGVWCMSEGGGGVGWGGMRCRCEGGGGVG